MHNFTLTNKATNELNIKLKLNNIRIKSVKDIMDSYTKKTRDELIAICKERKIKGYSSMKKDEIIQLLIGTNNINDNTGTTPGTTPEIIRYIDLFCGLGAFHTAFNSSTKFKCVLACDIDDGVRKIYKSNYGIEPVNDIRTIDVDTMPDFDLLCAGFPCQPFSIAGNGEGFKDKEKGNLFYDILKIIDAKTPRMCILENVKNLKTHDNGNTYKAIEAELLKRSYIITSKVINSAEYGSPQARQRIFIVATKIKPFVIPTPVKITNPVSTIIDTTYVKDELNRARYTLKAKTIKTKIDLSKPHILYDVFPVLSPEKKKILDEAKLQLEKIGGDPSTLDKGGRQGERVYGIDAVGITICASSGGPGAKTGLYKVGDNIRRLNVKETLGMFGFPNDYKFPEITNEDALFYLGNSIVVNVPLTFVPVIETWFA
jgi:DNA (cytosine-5)-methyltransferase 1